MMYEQKGSAMLCVLITMAGIFMIMSLVIRYTSYGIDIAYQRVVYEQHSFALKGLLNYGIMLAKQENIPETSLHIAPWLKDYTGILTFSKNKKSVMVQAQVYTPSKDTIAMQYTISEDNSIIS